MASSKKQIKQVQIIARIEEKRTFIVHYLVRSSNGVDQYHVTFSNGRAISCTCPARKPCYHIIQIEAKEQERNAYNEALVLLSQLLTAPLVIERTPEKEAAAHAAFAAADRIKPRVQVDKATHRPFVTTSPATPDGLVAIGPVLTASNPCKGAVVATGAILAKMIAAPLTRQGFHCLLNV